MKAIVFLLMLCASAVSAQSVWTMRGDNSTVEVEYLYPLILSQAYPSSVDIITLSSRIRVGDIASIIIEIPWISGPAPLISGQSNSSNHQSWIGNPYIGTEIGSSNSMLMGEIGFRLPLMSEDAASSAIAGISADFARFEAYTPQVFQVCGAANLRPELGGGFSSRLRFGPAFDISTREGGGSETLLEYCALMVYESEIFDAGAGVVGRASITANSSNSSIEQLECLARLHIDNVHPALQLRTPLDESLRKVYDFEFGINLALEF